MVSRILRRDGTMKRGPIEAAMAIESRSTTGVACRSGRHSVRSPLVVGSGNIDCNLDPRFERAPRPIRLENAICNTRSRCHRSCHHREPHVFDNNDLPLRALADRINAGAGGTDPDVDLDAAGAKTQGAFRNSGKPQRPQTGAGGRESRSGRVSFLRCRAKLADQSKLAEAADSCSIGCLHRWTCGFVRSRSRHGVF